MGYDTYLQVGERVALMWRKSQSAMPRFLFRHDQTQIAVVEVPEATRQAYQVEYRATAGEVLQTLRGGGLGWDSSVATYATIRQAVISESELYVNDMLVPLIKKRTSERTRSETDPGMPAPPKPWPLQPSEAPIKDEPEDDWDEAAWERKLAAFRAQSAATDLNALGELLAQQWLDAGVDDVAIFKDMVHESPIEVSYSFVTEIMDTAKEYDLDRFAVGRAVESFGVLYRDAPLLAWPLLITVLLQHLPQDTAVSYVLTEDAYQQDVRSEEAAKKYLDEYWLGSAEELVSQASTLGRLFGVLASFDSKVGREFWFAQAVDALARLDAMAEEQDVHSTKARGDALETLFEAILKTEEPELEVREKNYKTAEEEIDMILVNGLSHPFWIAQSSPFVFVECKNWSKPVGVKEVKELEMKMVDRAAICKIGIFVSMSGFAKTALDRLKKVQSKDGIIFAITGDDLRELITKKTRLTEWLRTEGASRALGK